MSNFPKKKITEEKIEAETYQPEALHEVLSMEEKTYQRSNEYHLNLNQIWSLNPSCPILNTPKHTKFCIHWNYCSEFLCMLYTALIFAP